MQPPRLLIAGASVRAAVQSARRAGFQDLIAADLFQDRDLGDVIGCQLSDGYRELARAAERLGADAWMYTGALENLPELVESVTVPLLGCPASALRLVRDPWRVARALCDAGLPTPQLARDAAGLPTDGTWLCKRFASAAGRHIHVVDGGRTAASSSLVYYQRRVIGPSESAVFVAAPGDCRLLGTTRQLIGVGDPGAGEFQYLGSLGPLPLSLERQRQWERIGQVLAQRFALRGLWGVDAVVADDQVWPVEVNPRYTASVEVLERTANWNACQLHWQACVEGRLPDLLSASSGGLAGKRIVFAAADVRVIPALLDWAEAQNAGQPWPSLADLPASPGPVRRGAPLLTVMVGPETGDDLAGLQRRLDQQVTQVHMMLNETSPI
jgi:predicted ATP-grasp superfamily ATP-dependent carboligase